MTIRPLGAALILTLASACASTQKSTVGLSRDLAAEGPAAKASPDTPADSGADPLLGVDQPFHGEWTSGGDVLGDVELLDELARYDLVCVGERHDDARHHWAQLAVLYGLSTRAKMAGRELGLGLEMVDFTFQPQLDRYTAGELDLTELTAEIEWARRWGFDFALYRPLFELARSRRIPLVGLNARREVTRAVARKGLRGLDHDSRNELPEWLDFEDPDHRAAFDAAMKDHPPGGEPENLYAAQVVWDETMAFHAAAWLRGHQPARQLVVAAGLAHCHRSAIPSRVERRMRGVKVISVVPSVGPPGRDDTLGYDIAMVMGTNH